MWYCDLCVYQMHYVVHHILSIILCVVYVAMSSVHYDKDIRKILYVELAVFKPQLMIFIKVPISMLIPRYLEVFYFNDLFQIE